MRIEFVEVRHFRKLRSIRIDLAEKTTLFVGANNSGKTSAIAVLGHFLVDSQRFTTNDFTLTTWSAINKIGEEWELASEKSAASQSNVDSWAHVLPSIDIWLTVADTEVHQVKHLIPTLDWAGGLLGVRLRFEPTSIDDLKKEFFVAVKAAQQTKKAAQDAHQETKYTVSLWPRSLKDFLDKRLKKTFALRAYTLDPSKCLAPQNGIARIQSLHPQSIAIEGDPFKGLIRIDEINAQRGFSDPAGKRDADIAPRETSQRRKLTDQLRTYYAKHLDPSEYPEAADLDALQAIETAQNLFDERLRVGFQAALEEVQRLGYPGVTDPKLTIATKLSPTDGLDHKAAVQYDVISKIGEVVATTLRLPEEYNGLGYQNLISMVFRLMSFRDGWMKVGKADKRAIAESTDAHERTIPPLHLVLIEEPEAHLHAQVQQVFIRKAYEILRKHSDLGDNPSLRTQLVVSTHSSHVAHESDFQCLRYFRRMPAIAPGDVPTSSVVNLSEVFGPGDETKKFVVRYLRATHCDLFFADAAILLEGPAERILVPHFVRKHFKVLDQSYVTYLEIGGSHAHRLKPLIDHLGLTTLIVTDLDAAEGTGHHAAQQPQRGKGQVSRNATLKEWLPGKTSVDDLLNLDSKECSKEFEALFAVCVAFQRPVQIQFHEGGAKEEALAGTFEDALVFENVDVFKSLNELGPLNVLREAIAASHSPAELGQAMFELLKKISKARLALDLLLHQEPTHLKVPSYIHDGLTWLEARLAKNQQETTDTIAAPATATPAVSA